MNYSWHQVIIGSILKVSKERFPETNFKKSLELIIVDFQDQITIDGSRHQDASLSRIGRRPETPVLDSWRIWNTIRYEGGPQDTDRGCWWVSCSFQVTADFIEEIFRGPSCVPQCTWGTLLRYLKFINENSDRWIPSDMEPEYRWEDHLWNVENLFIEVVVDVGHPVYESELLRLRQPLVRDRDRNVTTYRYWSQKFYAECEEHINSISSEQARELGYFIPESDPEPDPTPEPEPEPEPTPVQQSNDSVRKLQDMIDSVSRGEKPELNEGEYLQLSQSLKEFFVSQ